MKKIILLAMFISQTSTALDFADPEVSCSKGKYLVQIGQQDSDQLLGVLYKMGRINIPGQGSVAFPEALTELIPVKNVSTLLQTVYQGKDFSIQIWDATTDMPTGDPQIDGKCDTCAILKIVVAGQPKEIRGMDCQIKE